MKSEICVKANPLSLLVLAVILISSASSKRGMFEQMDRAISELVPLDPGWHMLVKEACGGNFEIHPSHCQNTI